MLLFLCSFDPPGQMSAGLTCELLVTFKPMVSFQKMFNPHAAELFASIFHSFEVTKNNYIYEK